MTSLAFPLFSRLPLELRSQIWRDSLDAHLRPALFFYQMYCWSTTRAVHDGYMECRFQHHLLDAKEFEVPQFFANHESRGITLAWAHAEEVEIRARDNAVPVFARRFDPVHDILYVSDSMDLNMHWELDDIYMNNDIPKLLFKSNISRVAVPESTLLGGVGSVDSLWFHFGLRELYFVPDSPRESIFHAQEVRPQLRLEVSRDAAFFRFNVDRGELELQDGEYAGEASLYGNIKKNTAFPWFLSREHDQNIESFEVRPALVIRR